MGCVSVWLLVDRVLLVLLHLAVHSRERRGVSMHLLNTIMITEYFTQANTASTQWL